VAGVARGAGAGLAVMIEVSLLWWYAQESDFDHEPQVTLTLGKWTLIPIPGGTAFEKPSSFCDRPPVGGNSAIRSTTGADLPDRAAGP
jgi:hypothetical protein